MKRMVRSWCVASGMSYEKLAERLSTPEKPVPLTTLKSWVYGQNRISLEDAARICDVFGKSIDELAGRMQYAPETA